MWALVLAFASNDAVNGTQKRTHYRHHIDVRHVRGIRRYVANDLIGYDVADNSDDANGVRHMSNP